MRVMRINENTVAEIAEDIHDSVIGELKYGGRVTPPGDLAAIIIAHLKEYNKKKTKKRE